MKRSSEYLQAERYGKIEASPHDKQADSMLIGVFWTGGPGSSKDSASIPNFDMESKVQARMDNGLRAPRCDLDCFRLKLRLVIPQTQLMAHRAIGQDSGEMQRAGFEMMAIWPRTASEDCRWT